MCSVFLSMCSGFLLQFVSGGNSEEDGPLDTTRSEKMQVCRLVIVGDPFISSVRSSSGYHGLLHINPVFQIFQILQILK